MSHLEDHPVEVKIGSTYLNRDNQKVKILFEVPSDDTDLDQNHPFIGFNQATGEWESYTERGFNYAWEPSEKDLIKEL